MLLVLLGSNGLLCLPLFKRLVCAAERVPKLRSMSKIRMVSKVLRDRQLLCLDAFYCIINMIVNVHQSIENASTSAQMDTHTGAPNEPTLWE